MRVLIVHDRPAVTAEIVNVIKDISQHSPTPDLADNVFQARQFLESRSYDLMIIDLTLPVMKGLTETRLEYAETLLKDAFAGEDLKTPADVIGISVDTDAVAGIRTSIGQHVLALVNEDPDGQWRQLLGDKIRYVVNTRKGRLLAAQTSYDRDFVILTALDKEASPYHDMLELSPSDEFVGGFDFGFNSVDSRPRRGLLLSVGKSGQAPAASAAQALITQLRPRLIIMTGFCGGVKRRVKLGEVAAFSSSAAWDYGKWEEAESGSSVFRARPDALNIPVKGVAGLVRSSIAENYKFDDALIAKLARDHQVDISQPELVSVAAGSGSAVITSEKILNQIVDLNENIHVVDMESYGFYYACHNTSVVSPDFICVKGVADHCNGEKNSKWHGPCSSLSASFALHIVKNCYNFN